MTGLTSPLHIVILLVIVLLLFGAKRLPEMGSSLGKVREFKGALTGENEHTPLVPTHTPVASIPELVTPMPAPLPEQPIVASAPQHDSV